jgi:hypothetical protein
MALNQGFSEIVLDKHLQNEFHAIFKEVADMKKKVSAKIDNIIQNIPALREPRLECEKWLTSQLSLTKNQEGMDAFNASHTDWARIGAWLPRFYCPEVPNELAEEWAEMVMEEALSEGLKHCVQLERALPSKKEIDSGVRGRTTEGCYRWSITNSPLKDSTRVLQFEPGSLQDLTTECLRCIRSVSSYYPPLSLEMEQRASKIFAKLLAEPRGYWQTKLFFLRGEGSRKSIDPTDVPISHEITSGTGTSIWDWLASVNLDQLVDPTVHSGFSTVNPTLTSTLGLEYRTFNSLPSDSGAAPSSVIGSVGKTNLLSKGSKASESQSMHGDREESTKLSGTFRKLREVVHR